MLTVIVLSPRARAALGDPRVLFEPFEQDGRIAFCDWNQSPLADTAREALPGLDRLVEGHREWRALVVDVPDRGDDTLATLRENPFDYLENTRADPQSGHSREALNLERSSHPFVRIAHILLGYPDMGAKGFETVVSYLDRDTGERILRHPAELGDDRPLNDLVAALRVEHRDVQVGYQEVAYTAAEQQAHESLRARYSTKSLRPVEVVFVATREPPEADPKTQLNRAWQTASDHHRSRFVERNDYPPSSRFAVYDLIDEANPGYSLDDFRFWLSILALAVNQLPPSSFQAERLYRMQTIVDEAELGTTLNAHLSHLAAVRDHIAALVRNPTRQPEVDVMEVVTQQHVAVEFSELNGETLGVSTSGYGLATDHPRDELTRWRGEMRTLRLEAETFAKKPRRVLSRAVFDARKQARSTVTRQLELSDIERGELEEEMRRLLPALTEPATSGILDRERFDRLLSAEGNAVEAYVHQRLSAKAIAITSVVVLIATLFGFVPFLVQAGSKGLAPFVESLLVVTLVLCLLAAAGLIALLAMRWRLLGLLRRLNSRLSAFVAGVGSGAVAFGEYLSTLSTYMYGRTVLDASQTKLDRGLDRRRRLAALHRRIVTFMESEKRILMSLGQPIAIHRMPEEVREFDVEDEGRVERVFQFPIGERTAAFNESGDYIQAPYDFVSRLRVERVAVLEPTPGEAPSTAHEDDMAQESGS